MEWGGCGGGFLLLLVVVVVVVSFLPDSFSVLFPIIQNNDINLKSAGACGSC